TFGVASLHELGAQQVAETPAAAPAPQHQPNPAPQSAPRTAPPEPRGFGDAAGVVAAIESLAGLHERGILSDEEFATKKAELLGRL
ncbi:MAG: hypothetical protein QOG37_2208, partial [Mycobacterium sp.]|nr:hypothetical protein [Mycobacterium sp.]